MFGRNVTGGAVLIRTTDPSEEFTLKTRAAVQSGEDYYYSLVTTGALMPGKLLGKFAVYYNDDGGYFKNKNTGNGQSNDNFGQSETLMVRLAATYLDQGGGETTLKLEDGSNEGDGPPGQNHAMFDRDTFDFAIDEEGENDSDWSRVTLEHVRSVGQGTLTNILGWKDLESYAVSDIDALPVPGFHAAIALEAEQISNELRYNILLNERFDVTAGLYYFQQDLTYIERRIIQGGAQDLTGGGVQETENWGIFTAVDYRLSESLTLLAGLRYTQEEKDADIATIPFNTCNVNTASCSSYDFSDSESWSNLSPKLGVQWYPMDTLQLYASFSQGFRSGGYNQRNTVPTASPGPFDEEQQNSFEMGFKLDAADGVLRLNGAVFHNTIEDMQREVNFADPNLGVAQVIVNSADATISGAEFELLAGLNQYFVLTANAGYLDGDYDDVREDLNRDGNVDGADENLALPRLAQWTYGIGLNFDMDVNDGDHITARVSFNHRDPSAYTDDNLGVLNSADMVNVSAAYGFANGVTLSLFGKNLKDEVTHGNDTQLPAAFGGPGASFAPLNKGRVYGAEIKYEY